LRTFDETHLFCPENEIFDWLWEPIKVQLRKALSEKGLNADTATGGHKDYKQYELNLLGLHCQWFIPLPD
jgi:hypothetical protein